MTTAIQDTVAAMKKAGTLPEGSYICNSTDDEQTMLPHRYENVTSEHAKLSVIDATDGQNNALLAKFTSRKDRDIYRGAGHDISDRNFDEIYQLLANQTIIEKPVIIDGQESPFYKALRLEDDSLLQIVPHNWQYLQPKQVLEIFYNHCQESGLILDRVGEFVRSKKRDNSAGQEQVQRNLTLFISAHIDDGYEVTPGDKISGRLLLKFPYIYTFGIPLSVLSIRNVCTNGQNAVVKIGSKSITHQGMTPNVLSNRLSQGLINSRILWKKQQENNKLLLNTEATKAEVILATIMSFSNIESHKAIAQEAYNDFCHNEHKHIDAIEHIYNGHTWELESELVQNVVTMFLDNRFTGWENCSNTMYGALQAATEHLNWYSSSRTTLNTILSGEKGRQINKFNQTILSMSYIKSEQTQGQKVIIH